MDLDDLDRIVERSSRSAFRLESLPQYLVPHEDEDFNTWLEGKPLAPRTPENSPWLARIQESSRNGYRWYRVHVLDQPLSAYTRFELAGYLENQAAGEEIYLADRSDHPDLGQLREDFWLIDDETAVRMVYDDDGHFLRPERDDDLATYLRMRDRALDHAIPLEEYLRRHRPSLTA